MNSLHIGDLTIPVPIVQGGMGIGISLSGLASAVANSGGVGVIATVGTGLVHGTSDKSFRKNNIEGTIKEIRKARQLSPGILGVNIMTVLSNYEDQVKTAIDEKIDIIFSGAGLPLDLPKYKTGLSKTKLVPIVSSARAASIIAQKWKNNYDYIPDAFVVEGPKAGGHLGFKYNDLTDNSVQLEELVSETVTLVKGLEQKYQRNIPVIAGGGVMSGKDIYNIFKLGATAVQMGSRFIATEECDASDEFKQRVINCEVDNIKIIKSPVGLPGRAIDNDFLKAAVKGERRPKNCKYCCIRSCNPKTTDYCIADALMSAFLGDFDNGFAFVGANAYQIKSLTTVPAIFQELMKNYQLEKQKKLGADAST